MGPITLLVDGLVNHFGMVVVSGVADVTKGWWGWNKSNSSFQCFCLGMDRSDITILKFFDLCLVPVSLDTLFFYLMSGNFSFGL